jgi:hypothetical protein
MTVDTPFPGIVAGSAIKVNGPIMAPAAVEFTEIQGPVSETVEYWMLVMTAFALLKLLKCPIGSVLLVIDQ